MTKAFNILMYAIAAYVFIYVVSIFTGGQIKGTLMNSVALVLSDMFPFVAFAFFIAIFLKLPTNSSISPAKIIIPSETKSSKNIEGSSSKSKQAKHDSKNEGVFWITANIIGIVVGVPSLFLIYLGMAILGSNYIEYVLGGIVPLMGIVFSAVCLLTYYFLKNSTKREMILIYPFYYLFFAILCVAFVSSPG